MTHAQHGPISRDDLKSAIGGLIGDSQETVVDAGTKVAGVASALAFLALALTYVTGRRRGRRARTVVEVRRV